MQQEERRLDHNRCSLFEVSQKVFIDDVGDRAGHETAVKRARELGNPRGYVS